MKWEDQCPDCGKVFAYTTYHRCEVEKPPKTKRKELKAKIAELERGCEALSNEVKTLLKLNEDLTVAMEQMRQNILNSQGVESEKDLAKTVSSIRKERNKLGVKVIELQDHINQIARENTELKSKVTQLTTQRDMEVDKQIELEARLVQTQHNFDEAMKVVKSWQKSAEELVAEKNKLVDKITDLEATSAKWLGWYIAASNNQKVLEGKISEFEKTTKDLSDDYLVKINEWRSCIQKIAELQEARDSYEHLARMKQSTIDYLDNNVKDLENILDALGYELKDGKIANKFKLM